MLLDLLFPPPCVGCSVSRPVGAEGPWCDDCALLAEPLPDLACPRCATPWRTGPRGRACARCRSRPPPFVSAWAGFVYGGPVADGIRAIKFAGRADLTGPLGDDLAWRLPTLAVDAVVPVPLHPARLRVRGFDQAERLARRLAWRRGWPLWSRALRRSVDTPALARIDRRTRQEAIARAFVPGRQARRLPGSRILLVDDVMTTGATLAACARVLRGSGAKEVRVAVAARTE